MDIRPCLTIEYELFGDGQGSIQHHILQPTEQLLAYCTPRNIQVPFFVEMGELLVFQDFVHRNKGVAILEKHYSATSLQL